MPAGLPDFVSISTPRGPDPVEYVGPGMWGAIYRSKTHSAYYRVLLTKDASIEAMQSVHDWAQGPSRPNIAPVTDVNIWFEEDCNYSYVRYDATGAQTLLDIFQANPPIDRIQHLAKAVRCLRTWRNFAGSGLPPMPAEIVFLANGSPVLLAAPYPPALGVEGILDCPSRVLFVSPEGLRGVSSVSDDAESIYAFVAMAALALHRPPELPPEEALLHGANRTLLAPATLQGTLPHWMDRLNAIQEMRKEIFRLLAIPSLERRRIEPDDLASRLDDWARRCAPITAVLLLQQEGQMEVASNLLREILGYEESYDLLILGATLAEIRKSALEGIEYLERAFSMDPSRKDALKHQLQLITRNPEIPPAVIGQNIPDWGSRLKSMLWRDFQELPARLQQQHEHEVAQFLIARSDFDEAAGFIYPRLFDEQKVHLWWKFDMALDYAEALMGKGTLEAAQEALNGIRIGIGKASAQRSVEADVLEKSTWRHGALERKLARIRLNLQRPAGGIQ